MRRTRSCNLAVLALIGLLVGLALATSPTSPASAQSGGLLLDPAQAELEAPTERQQNLEMGDQRQEALEGGENRLEQREAPSERQQELEEGSERQRELEH